jgi:uncharacterized delta-60 repeat protein
MKSLFRFTILLSVSLTQNAFSQQIGDLDSTFNQTGIHITPVSANEDESYAIAIQADGKIVVAGLVVDANFNSTIAIVRYNQDGTLDSDFATAGIYTRLINSNSIINALAIQQDGKIVAAGSTDDGTTTGTDFLVIRLNSNGTPDNTFGADGYVSTDFYENEDAITGIEIQTDNRIVATGYALDMNVYKFALTRYNADGSLDLNFSEDGKLAAPVGAANSFAYAISLQSDGKIVIGGFSENSTDADMALARYSANGLPDSTFNSTGIVITDIDGYDEKVFTLALQADGKIVAGGFSNNDSDDDFAIARYNADGSLDESFDADGILISDFYSDDEDIYSVLVQQDGKIVASGYTYNGQAYVFVLARYKTDGSIDSTFGGDGFVTSGIGNEDDTVYGSAIQADGKIVVTGSTKQTDGYDFVVARYVTGLDVGIFDVQSSVSSVKMYPNPVIKDACLEYTMLKSETISIQLTDLTGKVIKTYVEEIIQPAGQQKISIELDNKIAQGNYFLRIVSSSGVEALKITKL